MRTKYKKKIKLYYDILIKKGERQAGNNSNVLKEQLKKIIENAKKLKI
jgi:hypothetical protein